MERPNLFVVFIVGLVAAAIGVWAGMIGWQHSAMHTVPPAASASLPAAAVPVVTPSAGLPTLAPVLKTALPGVVNIAASGSMNIQSNPLFNDPFFRRFFGPFGLPFNNPDQPVRQRTQSIGSGVIVDAKNGYVVTNQHLINKAEEIYVVLQDKRKAKARVVGADPDMDIALLQVKEGNLIALPLGNSDTLQVGDFVMAIGNPFGLGNTATFGIVSALGRTGLGIEGYENFIQTDASINPGNSGGALINLKGELIGINTAIVSSGEGNVGIGFAIPINMAKQVMEELIAHGKISRGQLGVQVQDVTPELKDALGLDVDTGAIVTKVMPDSPAARAGIKEGDVIILLDGKNVSGAAGLRTMVGLKSVGEKAELELIRKGQHITLAATIGKPEAAANETEVEGMDLLKGAVFSAIPQNHPLYGKVQGVLVTKVDPDSPAAFAGLQEGDIILSINQQPVANLDDLAKTEKSDKNHLLINIQRGDAVLFIVVG